MSPVHLLTYCRPRLCSSALLQTPLVCAALPSLPVNTFAELLALALAAPGEQVISHGGIGTAIHHSVQFFKQMAKTVFNEVAYRGSGPVIVGLLGGRPLAMVGTPSALSHIKSGKVRALAATGSERAVTLCDVSTFSEAGLRGCESAGWPGFVAPAGTPAPVVTALLATITTTPNDSELRAAACMLGVELSPNTSPEFARFIKSEITKWGEVVKISGTRLE
ncbi:tripartite tricarboxylate transporter substrate-binding protein [Burkholderia sp. BCC0405]|uniref:Bug family tripartite tricarboxylate transporter substrate binding protein n=1 Tax=Burkholderia sp. BCC0405 TaxID=2676298 RepID=UPI002446120D|nr:tripartite tricarboxylate transporter substrate-binding protein [Burkholderia sp. BCC0405]